MYQRLVILAAVLMWLPGCFSTGAKALQGAIGETPDPLVVQAQVPDVNVNFQDIIFNQAPSSSSGEVAVGNSSTEHVEAQPEPWLHAQPERIDDEPDPFDTNVIQQALGPVFQDLENRLEALDDRMSGLEK